MRYAERGGRPMGVVAWYFVEDPDGRMVRTPRARVDRFIDGTERLPSASGTHVRAAEVFVEVAGRAVKRVHRVIWPKWALTADGLCDQAAREASMELTMQSLHWAEPGEPAEVAAAEAQREYVAEYTWQPEGAQLDAVARSLNGAAVRAPVVVVAREGLQIV